MTIQETKKLLKKLQGKKEDSNEYKSIYKKTKEIEKRLSKQVREDKKKAKEEKKKKAKPRKPSEYHKCAKVTGKCKGLGQGVKGYYKCATDAKCKKEDRVKVQSIKEKIQKTTQKEKVKKALKTYVNKKVTQKRKKPPPPKKEEETKHINKGIKVIKTYRDNVKYNYNMSYGGKVIKINISNEWYKNTKGYSKDLFATKMRNYIDKIIYAKPAKTKPNLDKYDIQVEFKDVDYFYKMNSKKKMITIGKDFWNNLKEDELRLLENKLRPYLKKKVNRILSQADKEELEQNKPKPPKKEEIKKEIKLTEKEKKLSERAKKRDEEYNRIVKSLEGRTNDDLQEELDKRQDEALEDYILDSYKLLKSLDKNKFIDLMASKGKADPKFTKDYVKKNKAIYEKHYKRYRQAHVDLNFKLDRLKSQFLSKTDGASRAIKRLKTGMIDYQTQEPIPEKDMDIRIWNHLKKYKKTYKFITGKEPEETNKTR